MNKQLSVTSRILVAFASGALIAVYFLPAWRIDLFAPQYPEGLSMYIWINKLTGDVDIINGLNHYIGMKHISADMFPEFRFMPMVVAFFILMGLLAAITGKRLILTIYLIFTILGGLLVPIDLYRWGYSYGHDLDPKAAIQVPGLSYQPPVFGHKRLLNFDAYSFPDIAGWIVVGAGILAALVWLVEWRRAKKAAPGNSFIKSAIGIFLAVSFFSCASHPEPFVLGKDQCYHCKMAVVDLKYGGEIITDKGKVYKFDDLGCMINFIQADDVGASKMKQILVMDYSKSNELIDVKSAWFVVGESIHTPMNSHLIGFADNNAAQKFKKQNNGEVKEWVEILQKNN